MSRPLRWPVVLAKFTFVCAVACASSASWAQGRIERMEVSGTVLDWRGQPVSQAEVVGSEVLYDYAAGRRAWRTPARTTTGTDGTFTMTVAMERPDYVWVVAWKQGLALGWQSVRLDPSAGDLVIRLDEPAVLAGTVVDESGDPLSSATVRLCLKMSWMGGSPGVPFETSSEWFATHTDGEGRFRFDHIPAGGTADFWVEALGKASCWTYWEHERSSIAGTQFQAGQTDIRIVLKAEGIIRGRVVDEDSGQGVAGVRLLARPNVRYANYACVPPAISGPGGTFVYRGLAADDYSLQVVAPYQQCADWVGQDVKVSVEAGQTLDVNIPVGKGALAEVTVLDSATDQPVENAGVNVSQQANFGLHPCWYQSVLTDANGIARLRVPAGQLSLRMWAEGYDHWIEPEPLVAARGESIRKRAALDRFPTVTGIVRDPSGQPAAGAIVASKPVCETESRTDAQGRYEVRWRPYDSIRNVLILARDPERNLAGLADVRDRAQPVDVRLAPAFVVRGHIMDPNGKAITAATISLWASMPGWRTNGAPDVLTDANGLYEIRAVAAPVESFTYRLGISAEGFGPTEYRDLPFDEAPGRNVEVGPVVLMPADKSISGMIVDANGTPVPGVPIFISGPRGSDTAGQPRHQTSSDPQGRFAVDGVCAGPLRIQAGYGDEAGFLDARGGDYDVEVVLGRRGVHTGLKPLLGKPLPDWKDLVDLDSAPPPGKPVLICFFDFQQRPSRNTLMRLAKQTEPLRRKDIAVLAVQASQVDADALSEWIDQSNVTLPVGRIRGDADATRLAWGVKSLPWLILANDRHVVTAEGFAVAELEERLATTGASR